MINVLLPISAAVITVLAIYTVGLAILIFILCFLFKTKALQCYEHKDYENLTDDAVAAPYDSTAPAQKEWFTCVQRPTSFADLPDDFEAHLTSIF